MQSGSMSSLMAFFLLAISAPSFGASYPQLIATRYPEGSKLPEEASRPITCFDFVAQDLLPAGAKVLSAARAASGRVLVVTDQGAFGSSGEKFERLEIGPRQPEPGQPEVRSFAKVVAIAGDAIGHVWIATDRGLFATDGEQWWQSIDRRDGVPYETLTCLYLSPNGDVWAGTPEGAWRLRDGQYRYFWGKRWLPDNRVQAIWSDAKNRIWLETKKGVSCIEERPMTLAEKAGHYDEITWSRHNRRGFICEIKLKTPGDVNSPHTFNVNDNDGLWTSMYVAAMSLRYAATKSPEARLHANGSLKALLDLERLPGLPGFPARAIATDDELQKGVLGVHLDDTVLTPGETTKIWFRSKLDPKLWCKGDTSSDELDGHYFAWYLYHDLVADEAEKTEIAGVVRRVTDHIMNNGYNLVGHTGQKTRWGIWAPELINHHPFYHDLRALNSLEILSFLKVAEHITGDAKYDRAYDELIEKHHYLLNSLMMRRGVTGRWPDINHSDDELLYLVYYPLLMLEKDPARRRILVQSIARTWEETPGEQSIRPEHSPFYNFVYGATTGRRCDVDESIETLRDWPWELIDWTVNNTQRHDVVVKTEPGVHRHRIQLDRVLPISERAQGRWNRSPWTPDDGTDGRREFDGVAWSLSYWLGVHHGYIPPTE
ncbi:hypothetical protein [Singulisphaera sp. PoT]|uniref:hypothetical protein n=1 Tax=Singulisphaera sp. PoT TaxID=3411797 RepID=UPI003BF5B5CB